MLLLLTLTISLLQDMTLNCCKNIDPAITSLEEELTSVVQPEEK